MNAIELFIETAEKAFWRGQFEKERRKDHGKPGEFFNNLPEETKEAFRQMKSEDFNKVRWDEIKWMCNSLQGM